MVELKVNSLFVFITSQFPDSLQRVMGHTYAVTNHREEAEKILLEIEARPIDSNNAVCLAGLNAVLGN